MASRLNQPGAPRSTAASGPKKLTIKAYKVKPKLADNFEQTTWNKLEVAVKGIQMHQTTQLGYQELYQAVEDLCIHNLAASTFERLQTLCDQHIGRMLLGLVGQTPDPIAFLSLVAECWANHCSQMATIRHVFMYLDRSYVLQNAAVRSLWDMGLQIFRKHLNFSPEVGRKLVTGILQLIAKERRGDQVDRDLIRDLLRMASALGLYAVDFEPVFLAESTQFYEAESQRTLEEVQVADYLLHVSKRLQEENDRVANYLDHSSRKPLIQVVEQELLEKHVSAIIDKGFDVLMQDGRKEDLGRMYSLLARCDAFTQLKNAFQAYIRKTGGDIVTNDGNDKDMVQSLLDFKAKLDFVLAEAFEDNEDLTHALKDSFESFINVRQNKPAELIAKFIDGKLRAGHKASSDDELEAVLDRVMVIFRHIQGKDVFEAFYKKDLAKRLLMGKSASTDAEKSMISKLKQQCGSSFTNKLEGMFKDIDLSKDVMISFKETASVRDRTADFELSVNVLTTGFWPNYQPAQLNLPKALEEMQELFKVFYLSKHSGRRLMWQHSLGHCTLKSRFKTCTKELLVSFFQTVILLLFNDADSISFKDIRAATGMEDRELRVTLQSLACAKVRVLRKEPKGRDVGDDDVFFFEEGFKHKQVRIKINSIQMKESEEENKSTTERVFQDRHFQIDAAVVRVMKARKSLSHNLLISELFRQLKFPVAPPDLKKRIESLIDREYLERDEEDTTKYNYVA